MRVVYFLEERKSAELIQKKTDWGRIGFVDNKKTNCAEIERKCATMKIVTCELNYPSVTYKLCNPTANAIISSNSTCGSDFKLYEAKDLNSSIGILKPATLGKMKVIMKYTDEIIMESITENEHKDPQRPQHLSLCIIPHLHYIY